MAKLPEKTSDSLNRALLDLLPGPAGVVDSSGKIYFANAEFERAFGLRAGTSENVSLEEILSPGSSAWIFLNDRLENARETSGPLAFDLTVSQAGESRKLNLEARCLGAQSASGAQQWFLISTPSRPSEAEKTAGARGESEAIATRYAEIKRCPPALVKLVEKALGDFIGRITSVMNARDQRLLLSRLHGLKGTTLMVGLKSIAGRVHELESELAQGETKFLSGDFDQKLAELTADLDETRRMFGLVHGAAGSKPGQESPDEVYGSIQRMFTKYDQLISSRPNWGARIAAERIDWAIRSVNRASNTELRDFFTNQVEQAARAAGKQVDVEWQSDVMPIDEDARKVLVEVFTHIATNAVAHGIEPVDERKARGKRERGKVRAEIRYDGSVLEGIVFDDGRGIDPKTIKASALARGAKSKEALAAMSDDETLKLIFDPGFSTRKAVDKLSGRGVGLDAVRTALASADGEIRVCSTIGGGTEFAFSFRPPTARPSAKKLLTYKAIYNQLMGVLGYQADHEQLPVRITDEIVNRSPLETGLVYADDVRLMAAVSGVIGTLAEKSACAVTMSVDADGRVRLTVHREPLSKPLVLPEQYALLKDSFSLWIRLNGGQIIENADGSVDILVGGTLSAGELPLLELRPVADFGAQDFASVMKAVRIAGTAMGFQVVDPSSKPSTQPKLALVAAYADYVERPGEIAVRYQQHPAEIKSVLISAMERVLRAA